MFRLLLMLLVSVLTAPAAHVRAEAEKAVTYTARLEQSATADNGKTESSTIVVHTTGRSTDARAEVVEGNKEMRRGNVLLANDGGRRLFIVNPQGREYEELTPSTFEIEAAVVGKSLKLDVERSQVRVEDLGAGERIAGMPTHHYRMTRELEGVVRIAIFNERLTFEETIEYWFSPELDEVPNPLAALITSATGMFPALHAETRAKYAAALRELPGLNPVRLEYSATETDSKGKRKLTKATVSVDDLRDANADTVSFELPSGLQRKRK